MPAARPPLKVEVVTKIPVKTGLGLADPGVTGGLATARTAANRAVAEVVTDVPGTLRNITPLTFGQKAAQVGQIGAKIVSGLNPITLGIQTAVDLAQDLLFPKPAGLGSDMVGGVKIGSQPKPAPTTAPVTSSQPIAKPQVTAAPYRPPAPVVAPVAAPTKPKPKIQTETQPQTQPLPLPTTAQPQSAPVQTAPRPQPIAIPTPRSALETPLPSRPKPLTTESPFPLNIVGLNSYGGVNLTYPIAQKLIKLPEEISALLQPDLEKIEIGLEKVEKLSELPQTIENLLKNARIETSINLPVATDLIAQLPFQIDLSKQIPVATDLTAQLPFQIDLSKQIPVATDLTAQLPFQIDLSKQIPVATDLTAQLPFQIDLSKQIPVATDLTAQLPFQIDLSKEIPVAVDLSAVLQPDTEASGLKSLQECCESIQKTLAKEAAIIEGRGELYCDGNTVPYSYRGEGLKGIHQLIQIVLGANKQILEKVCTFNIEYPLIAGSGVYQCGTLPAIPYGYSGVGFIGIQNQIDQLFNLDKQILTEVCEIGSSPFGSLPFPEISGQIEYFDCDYTTQAILYSGNGLQGLSKQVDALSTLVKVGVKAACEASSTVIMPDARFEEFRPVGQIMLTWGTQYPTQGGSLWQTYLPDPKEGLEWCKDFENLATTKGNIYGRVRWENSKIPTGIYCDTEEEAIRILRMLVTLSNATPTLDEDGLPHVFIGKGKKVKKQSLERSVRVVRAAVTKFGEDSEVSSLRCFVPPPGGCLPTLL